MDSPDAPPRVSPLPDHATRGRIVGGKYRLGERIGKGGRGEVYAAVQMDLAREVAVKLVPDIDEEARARFLHEARVAAGIRHPCVVEIFDAGVDADGTPYCAMELLEGETLAARIDREGPLPVDEVVAIAASVASALGAVHDKGFLHRDVKPSNVLLAKRADGGVDPKLIDFGIAKRIAVDPEVVRRATQTGLGPARGLKATAPGLIVGTPRYLAPEQILGGDLDVRCDVYALGVTTYEALAGEPPFAAGDMGELLAKIVCAERPPLAKRAKDAAIPAGIDREVLRAIAKDPADRHASAADFAQALWAVLAAAERGVSGAPIAAPPTRRPGRGALIAAAIAIAATFAIVLARRAPTPPPATAIVTAAPSATPTAEPESAVPQATPSALPEPTAKGAEVHPSPPRAPFARSAEKPAPTASAPTAARPPATLRIDDLKAPY